MEDKNAINQLIGQSPSWMLRWGILVIALFFVLSVLFAWLIQYPDTISGSVRLHTTTLPITVQMPTDGRIDSFFLHDRRVTTKHSLLAVVQSASAYQDMLELERFCKKWTSNSQQTIPENLQLGTLSSYWADFQLHQKELQAFYQNDISAARKKNIQNQISKLEELHHALLRQEDTFRENINLAQAAQERDEKLFEEKVTSASAVEQSKRTSLHARQQMEQHQNRMIDNQVEVEKLRAAILEIDYQQKDASSDYRLQLEKDIAELRSAMEVWKEQHLIYAPIGGTVVVDENWTLGQFLDQGTPLVHIVPKDKSNEQLVATVLVEGHRFGKIYPNAEVQIRLDAYPYQEYGILKGRVTQLPSIAQDGLYELKISLKRPLLSSYQKEIPFQQGLEGIALITTQKRRLAERFFDRILSVWKNN